MRIKLLIILIISINLVNADSGIIYKHHYELSKHNIKFAESINSLYRDGPRWTYRIESNSAGIFKIKKDNRVEQSSFIKNNETLVTLKYTFKKTTKEKKENIETNFSNKNNYAFTIKDDLELEHLDLSNPFDRLSVQIDIKDQIKNGIYNKEYSVIDKGRVRKYYFSLFGYEDIETIFGMTETLIIRKKIEGSKRNTLTWYAINHDFIPVMIKQYRKNSLKFNAKLKKINH